MFNFGANPLITQENFEAFTGIKETNLSADEKSKVEFTVKSVSSQIRKFCSFFFNSSSYTEVWDGQGSDVLIPSETPLISVESIKLSSDGKFDNSQSLDIYDYVIHPMKQFITLRYMRFPRGRGLIEVKYTAGYEDIPEDLQMAICLQYQFISKTSSNPGVTSIEKMNEKQTWDDKVAEFGMPTQVFSIVKNYRRLEAPLSIMFARVS